MTEVLTNVNYLHMATQHTLQLIVVIVYTAIYLIDFASNNKRVGARYIIVVAWKWP